MTARRIEGMTALVTGANRGIGRAITEALLERGATRVYAGARNVDSLSALVGAYGDRIVPLVLDVTDPVLVERAAAAVEEIDLLVNNAGVALANDLAAPELLDQARREMEVNYFAPLAMSRRLAGTLAANGGGAIVNIVSVGGLTSFPFYPTYSASKAAAHSLTQGLRILLAGQGTAVFGVYPGPVDTDMARGIDMEKATPASVAAAILDGIESGHEEIYPDPFAVQFGEQYGASPKESERQVQAMFLEALATQT